MYLSRDSSDGSRSTSSTSTDISGGSASITAASTTTGSASLPKEPAVTQRVTRSSQRFAQQNGDINNESKIANVNDNNNDCDDNNSSAANSQIDKTAPDQSGRKPKRKKLEQQADSEQDSSQQALQPIFVPEFCPADYQLPKSNSFQLYRSIVNQRHKEVMALAVNHNTKLPNGIKDYLVFNGPYLLDGDKLGVGLRGSSIKRSLIDLPDHQPLPRLKMKFSRTQNGSFKLLSPFPHQLSNQRLHTYTVPQPSEAPVALSSNSPLFELFQSQEKARLRMRLQHLKERERSILTSEQEVLRAYNRNFNLSVCNYLNHQEKYHYIHEKEDGLGENLDYPPTARDPVQLSSSSLKAENDDESSNTASTSVGAAEQKVIPKLIHDLQELDDKWEKIKAEMFIRHKNESDTLYAMQSLEWEWRSKETGCCDVEFVPRVEVPASEY